MLNRANEKLNTLANTDHLTMLSNRRAFYGDVEKLLPAIRRNEIHVSLLLLDIDFFKAYNDNYGHQKGDDCLKKCALYLSGFAKRDGELIARYGGEEFIFFMSGMNEQAALKFAQRVVEGFKSLNIKHEYSHIKNYMTASIGYVSTKAEKDLKIDVLIHKADSALYKAKRSGRNKFIAYSH